MFNYRKLDSSQCKFINVAGIEEVKNGQRMFIEIDDLSIVLFNIGGEYFAIENECSHDGGPIGEGDLEEMSIVCPRHGAKFDIATGQVLSLPAVEDIPAYPVRVKKDRIQIGIPKKSV
ncbi:MAG: Rieske (2Fe-2S) protein [Anaerolineales bacterium]